jgi:DNA repair protein RecN (Recombination protein N)
VFELEPSHPVWRELKEWGWEDEEEGSLLIRREITANGKSTCRVNGRTVTLSMLKKIGRWLIDLSGQHEHQTLLDPEEHLGWLDRFAGDELLALREKYESKFAEYQEAKRELEKLSLNQKEIAQRLDLLSFQCGEIEAAALRPGEDEELEQERNRLVHAEKLIRNAAQAYEYLYGEQGGLDRLQEALVCLEQAAQVDSELDPVREAVQSAYYQLEEAAREVRRYREGFEFEPERLVEVEERLHLIRQLKRKYGDTIEEILEYGARVKKELEELEHREEREEALNEQVEALRAELLALAAELTQKRKRAAAELERRVEKELADLNMGRTVFHVAFYPDAYRSGQLLASGQDLVEFQISPNPGEPLKPLVKIASGGELSRLMLALKVIFADLGGVHTLIFDEIDTGVSGRAAQAIAEKMAMLSQKHQVLSVTHLPQVACMADRHLAIYKETSGEKTRTRVCELDRQGRIDELARMIGGVEVTETAREHAEEMLNLAKAAKASLV